MPTVKSVFLGICNPKSPTNVGAIIRAAGCYGVSAIRYTGERFARAAKFHTDTQNAKSQIPLTHVDDLIDELPSDMHIVCIELAEGAIPLPDYIHPENACYIFGPEDGSIAQALIDQAHAVVYVPTIGCMNLAATVNVVLYDRLAKTQSHIDHDKRIKQSRDANNRLVVSRSN